MHIYIVLHEYIYTYILITLFIRGIKIQFKTIYTSIIHHLKL